MYVCLCNGYRESEIREAAKGGIRCARALYAKLGGEARCGKCLPIAQDLIDGVHGAASGHVPAAPPLAPAS